MRAQVVIRSAVVAATLTAVAPAAGADFTLLVPVRLASIPADREIVVACAVSGGGRIPDSAETRVPMPASGNYTGTVRVEVNVRADVDPASVDHYRCSLDYLTGLSGRTRVPPMRAGTPFRINVEGAIP